MLRVGLTGGVGSGKSAVARVWEAAGVAIVEADALGRALMQPGQAVYAGIVAAFGPGVVQPGGQLDRAALAQQAFGGGRLDELNALIHPAVMTGQEEALQQLAADGHALAVVESALIFEVSGLTGESMPWESSGAKATAPGWRQRFDRLVLVAAPEAVRIERFITRVAGQQASQAQRELLREDALRRMHAQLPEAWKRPQCDYVIENDRTLVLLRREALRVLAMLRREAETPALPDGST